MRGEGDRRCLLSECFYNTRRRIEEWFFYIYIMEIWTRSTFDVTKSYNSTDRYRSTCLRKRRSSCLEGNLFTLEVHNLFINFLAWFLSFIRPEILEELVNLVLQPPDESKEECLKYKWVRALCDMCEDISGLCCFSITPWGYWITGHFD